MTTSLICLFLLNTPYAQASGLAPTPDDGPSQGEFVTALKVDLAGPLVFSHLQALLRSHHIEFDLQPTPSAWLLVPKGQLQKTRKICAEDARLQILFQSNYAGIDWRLGSTLEELLRENRNDQLTRVLRTEDFQRRIADNPKTVVKSAKLKDYEYLSDVGVISVGYRVTLLLDDGDRYGLLLETFDVTDDEVCVVRVKRLASRRQSKI